jgi:GntR family transcriptional regulator / MocR family aminotransferase
MGLKPATRLPSSRDLARQYGVSRGTVVAAFEQLQAEGYLRSRIGAGTYVCDWLPDDILLANHPRLHAVRQQAEPAPQAESGPARAFRANLPAVEAFPIEVWTRVASRRFRRASRSLFASGDVCGYRPLREVVADYLGASRGVKCIAEQVVIVSGAQQALDLVARLLLRPDDPVWMEDPGYPGASAAFRNAGAKIIAVPVDEHGLDVVRGRFLCQRARAVYTTPAHQFPLGMALPLERRLALLEWARRSGAFIIEDDYDSEYRYTGRPLPALQGLDRSGSVIFVGTFSKVLFPSLRLAYLILPEPLVEPLAALRFNVDRYSSTLEQAILCDFISEGHLARHIRRMRQFYAERLGVFLDASRRRLNGLLDVPSIEAGLHIAGFLPKAITSGQAAGAAAAHGVETLALESFVLQRRDLHGLLLGFAAFDAPEIRRGIAELAMALEEVRH